MEYPFYGVPVLWSTRFMEYPFVVLWSTSHWFVELTFVL